MGVLNESEGPLPGKTGGGAAASPTVAELEEMRRLVDLEAAIEKGRTLGGTWRRLRGEATEKGAAEVVVRDKGEVGEGTISAFIKELGSTQRQVIDILNTTRSDQVKLLMGGYDRELKTIRDQLPTDPFQAVERYEALLDRISTKIRAGQPATGAGNVDGPTILKMEQEKTERDVRLTTMTQAHELALKRIEQELEESRAARAEALALRREELALKQSELTEKSTMRRKAAGSLEELTNAIAESLGEEDERAAPQSGVGAQAEKAAGGGEVEVDMVSFPCQSCQSPIEIPPGSETVSCPQCGSKYQVVRRA